MNRSLVYRVFFIASTISVSAFSKGTLLDDIKFSDGVCNSMIILKELQ